MCDLQVELHYELIFNISLLISFALFRVQTLPSLDRGCEDLSCLTTGKIRFHPELRTVLARSNGHSTGWAVVLNLSQTAIPDPFASSHLQHSFMMHYAQRRQDMVCNGGFLFPSIQFSGSSLNVWDPLLSCRTQVLYLNPWHRRQKTLCIDHLYFPR